MRRSWPIDAEDACARRFSICEVVIHEKCGRRLRQGARDLSDVESACVDGSLVHIRFCEFGPRAVKDFVEEPRPVFGLIDPAAGEPIAIWLCQQLGSANLSLLYAKTIVTRQEKYEGE